jgi:putative flippase GtrA
MSISFNRLGILIPTLNPNEKIVDLIQELSIFNWFEIAVVNDGSINNTNKIFETLRNIKCVHILEHASNQGKGAALKTGIKHFSKKLEYLDGIITVDSDGQHLTKDIIKISKETKNRKNDVIFGVRSFDESTPFKSKFGNKVTKYLMYIFNGISLNDTQTGLRYIPTSIFNDFLKLPGNKYEFELECIFTIKKLGYKITQIPINTVYINDNKGSHFRPLIDSSRIYLVFLRFSLSSFLSFGLDITLFALLLSYQESIILATLLARIISGVFNFTLNRNIVFQASKEGNLIKELIGYFGLWLCLLIMSGFIVSSLQGSPAFLVIPFKILVDLALFLMAFYIQKNLIFKTII